MKVTPISDNAAHTQANAFRCWPRGLYDFEVLTAIDKVSGAGNDMVELELRVYNTEGKERTVKDWLVSSEGMAYKLRHFASATGMLPQYERGELKSSEMPGKTGRCQLGIEAGKQVPGTNDKYPDKNKVQDYAPTVAGGKTPLIASVADMDDEVPF